MFECVYMTVRYGQIKSVVRQFDPGMTPQMSQTMTIQPLGRHALMACAAVLALQAAACADLPNDHAPRPQPKPPEAYQDQRSFAAPATDWPTDRWWDAYGDTQLSGLIDEALKGSPTLAQAEARLISASASTELARAASLPSVRAAAGVAEAEASREIGFPPFIAQLLPN